MAPNIKVSKALSAMRAIGIPEETVKPVLKNLLKVYDKNWGLIEGENYRALADAIFECEENKEEEEEEDDHGSPLKRLRLKHQDQVSPSSVGNSGSLTTGQTSLKKPKLEENPPIEISTNRPPPQLFPRDKTAEHEAVSPESHLRDKRKECTKEPHFRDKGKEPISPQISSREKRPVSKGSSGICIKEPIDDLPQLEVPNASLIHPLRPRINGGGTLRRSPRISKSMSLEKEPTKKKCRRKSSLSKEGNKKDKDNEETEASDGEKIATAAAKLAQGTQARSDVEIKKAEDGREMNKQVPNGEVLPGGESLDIIVVGSKDENEENITKKSRKTKYSEAGDEMDSNTKEDEMNTAEKQTEAKNQEKEEKIVLGGELQAPPGWTKKLIPKKSRTSKRKRNEIVFISPTGEEIKNKRQLDQFLKSNPGGPTSSKFYWGTGDKSKRGRKSSSNRYSMSKLRDDQNSVGNWVHKDFVSRDGQMKLGGHVFFASIDQRSQSAGGESACTVLVVVIANWFQTNHDSMPTDSQFDSLIREGSREWRNLCAEETIKKQFPDKHLELQTVLQANIRPISSSSEKSFVGFFLPDGMKEEDFEFLNDTMSFDRIWDEISSCAEKNCVSGGGPQVYIVSWNDHFFILKVEAEAYYLLDTFGERLYEGCDQAYILKFDKDTTIHSLREVVKKTETVDQLIMAEAEKETDTVPQLKLKEVDQLIIAVAEKETDTVPQRKLKEDLIANVESGKKEDILCRRKESGEQEDIVCKGKESCKEYIKSFLAAIALRELLFI